MGSDDVQVNGGQPAERDGTIVSDRLLAELAAEGASTAVRLLLEHHGQEVFRFCAALAGEEEGETAFKGTIARGVVALRKGTVRHEVRTWLLTTARREVEGLGAPLRVAPTGAARAGGAAASADAPAGHGETAAASPEAAPATEDTAGFGVRFDSLAPVARGSVVLRELGGLGYDKLAAIFGVRADAVREVVTGTRSVLLAGISRGPLCDEARQLIADDESGEPSPEVRAHLEECEECGRARLSLANIAEALDRELPRVAHGTLLKEIERAGAEAEPAQHGDGGRMRRGGACRRSLALGAALGALFVLVSAGTAALVQDPFDDAPRSVRFAGQAAGVSLGTVGIGCPERRRDADGECADPMEKCKAPEVRRDGECVVPRARRCLPPRKLIDGECRTVPVIECLDPRVVIDGDCVLPDPPCLPPRKLIDGECRTVPVIECLDPRVVIDGECVVPRARRCLPPRKLIDGECVIRRL